MKKLQFIGFYAASIILIIILTAAYLRPLPTRDEKASVNTGGSADNQILAIDNVLHKRLNELYRTHSEYLGSQHKKRDVEQFASQNFLSAERALKNTIDSVEKQKGAFLTYASFDTILSSFKLISSTYDNSNAVAPVTSINAEKDNSNDEAILQLKRELESKDRKITEMEKQLQASKPPSSVPVSGDYAKLQNENKTLSTTVNSLSSRNASLAEANKSMKKEIEKLNRQIDAFRKFTGANNQ
jgi:DNA repair exonuclease SbcCD ATPase subunit